MTLADDLIRQLQIRKWRLGGFVLATFGTAMLASIIGIRLPQPVQLVLLLGWLPALLLVRRWGPVCPACQTKWRILVQDADLTGQSGQRLVHCPYCAARLADDVANGGVRSRTDSALKVTQAIAIGLVATVWGGLLAADRFVVSRYDPRAAQPVDQITVYSAEWCGPCKQLKACFDSSGVPYTDKDIEKSDEARMEHWALHAKGIPATLIGSTLIVGLKRDRIRYFVQKAGFDIGCWAGER